MDLRHAIPELRKVIQFLKPLMQADELLKSILDFEKQAVEKKEVVIKLDKLIENKERALEDITQRTKEEDAKRTFEVNKTKAVLAEEKAKESDVWDNKISLKQEEHIGLVAKVEDVQVNIIRLEGGERELEEKVSKLKNVIKKTLAGAMED